MRRIGIILLVIMTLHACKEVPDVSFVIKTEGFSLENASLNQGFVPPSFLHHINGGVVNFSGNGATRHFDLRNADLESFLFTLPAGEYQLDFSMSPASLYGQPYATFISEPLIINLDESTDTIHVSVEATCALFLVDDGKQQLEEGIHMIKRHSYSNGYFTSYPLEKDERSGLYYAYFTPDPIVSDPSAFLWFYEGRPGLAEGGLSTCGFTIGYQYYIRILD